MTTGVREGSAASRSGPRWLFWHRRDLRLADNLGLAAAARITPAVTGVFVIDADWLSASDQASARLWFLAESLRELRQRWQEAGSRLLVLEGEATELLPRLARAIQAEVVTWNRGVEPAERHRDRAVAAALQADGTRVLVDWDQLLVPPEALRTGSGDPYRVYGPYWRSWRKWLDGLPPAALTPRPAPGGLLDLEATSQAAVLADGLEADPAAALERLAARGRGFAGAALCPCRPGETAAAAQLAAFSQRALLDYEQGRNHPAEPGTSGLSAALRFGTLSPRMAWAAAQAMRPATGSHEQEQAITVWEQELAWREFYQQALFHFPALASGPYRPQWQHFPWENDTGRFDAWREGLSGVPIVDAAMRQLNQSGWMHNRCRMIVASFLVKDLICDWRWGERAFMRRLVDGDLAANNGGWQWSASSGMDPKPLRIFNPFTQAARFDPEAVYIRRWLPELAHVATADLIRGEIAPLERRGYPEPIVDHRQQQAHFKALHARLR
ncbi:MULTISPECIES: FAD-binding domain-containing protein [unclassified Synechococcus]|uniref:FAD-binding domain-containing protein n=1 Tax=unclassified Synechococcus TaxID=2626047 RepID=UPI0021A355EA|nr:MULTISPECIES: FAD-binding domain-containing protein [unclassified Synechococcus]